MKFLIVLAALQLVSAVTLTYKMAPHERACFYTDSKTVNEKFGFYFSVRNNQN